MSRAAKRETGFPPPPICVSDANGLVFSNAGLPKTRVGGPNLENQAFIEALSWLSSTSRWGCGYRYDGTASGRLVGLDYADQRMYASTYGRFNTPDPYQAGGAANGSVSNPSDPGSWNRYSYTRGDPVNRLDPRGLYDCGDGWVSDASLTGPCYPGVGPGFWGAQIGAAIANAYAYASADAEKIAPPELCPLVSIVGNFTNDPNSPTPIHDIFDPTVAYAIDAVFATLNAQGINPILEDGFRTEQEQSARRRTSPQAAKGLSWHEVGDAIDFKRSDPNLAAINAAMIGAGFKPVAGDKGHYQMPTGVLTQSRVDECTKEHPFGN